LIWLSPITKPASISAKRFYAFCFPM
jgi:hypothetical protein